jgi:hypothetical protein
MPLRFAVGVLCAAIGVAPGIASAQVYSWVSSIDGAWNDSARWSPQGVPNTSSESVELDRFGSFTVALAAGTTTLGSLQQSRGQVRLVADANAAASLSVSGDANLGGGELRLERRTQSAAAPALAIGQRLEVADGALLRVSGGASLAAQRMAVNAGTGQRTSELLLLGGATASVGALAIGDANTGAFEGLVTLLEATSLDVGGLWIGTTGVVDRRGYLNAVGARVTQHADAVAFIGGPTGGEGQLRLSAGAELLGERLRVQPTGMVVVSASTLVAARELTIAGVVRVEQQGTITLGPTARLTLQPGGRLELGAAPLSLPRGGTLRLDGGQVVSQGSIALEGTLEVALPASISPQAGDAIDLLVGSAIVGSFARATLPALGPGLAWRLASTPTRLSLVAEMRMAGDYNADGQVDAADYTAWRDAVGTTGVLLPSDGDTDGQVGAGDYAVWRRDYGRAAGPLPLPEPATLALTTALAFTASRRPNR